MTGSFEPPVENGHILTSPFAQPAPDSPSLAFCPKVPYLLLLAICDDIIVHFHVFFLHFKKGKQLSCFPVCSLEERSPFKTENLKAVLSFHSRANLKMIANIKLSELFPLKYPKVLKYWDT